MVNRVKALAVRCRTFSAALLVLALSVLAGPSFAQAPTPSFNYNSAVTGAQAQIVADIGSVLPTLFIFCGVMLVIRWVWKKFKSSARSA